MGQESMQKLSSIDKTVRKTGAGSAPPRPGTPGGTRGPRARERKAAARGRSRVLRGEYY